MSILQQLHFWEMRLFFVKARVENYMVISGDLLTWESLYWTNFFRKGFRGFLFVVVFFFF